MTTTSVEPLATVAACPKERQGSSIPRVALGVVESALAAGLSRRQLCKMIADGNGPPVVRAGARVLIRSQALDDWLAGMEAPWTPIPRKRGRPRRAAAAPRSEGQSEGKTATEKEGTADL